MRLLGRLARIQAEWQVAEPRWPHFRLQLEAVQPDLIVLDLSKHPTHGIETACYLQKNADYAGIPLYAVNATPTAARKLGLRAPGVPVVSVERLCDDLRLGS